MKALILIIKSNFKAKKWMNLLTGLSIMLAVLLFSAALAILQSIQEPFDKLFHKLNASHIVMLYDATVHNTEEIKKWYRHQPETERISEPSPYFLSNSPLLYKDNKMEIMVQITEFNNDHNTQDKLIVIDGKKKEAPGFGEIWIPQYLANNYQVKVGDSIGIPSPGGLHHVIVSATVGDPHYGSGMVNPTRAWVAPGELSFFVPVTQLSNTMLGIRLKNGVSETALLQRFTRKFNYTGVNLTYSLFKSAYMSIYQVIGNIMMIFSVMALLIALLMVRTAIKRSVYDDYKYIGVYKALGFTPENLIRLFIIQYVLLALVFVPLSFAGTYFITNTTVSSIIHKTGPVDTEGTALLPVFIITGSIVMLLVIITAWLASYSASKIKPVEAIRSGAPVKSFSGFLLPANMALSALPLPLIMGMRFVTSNLRRSIVQGLIILVAIFVVIFSVNVSSSFENLKYNKPAWGFENGDLQIIRKDAVVIALTHEQLMNILSTEKEVVSTVPFSYTNLSVLSTDGQPVQDINGKLYADSLYKAGLLNLYGRHPQGTDEISLCIGTARQFNKQPGDSIAVFIEGQRANFLITGVYQDVGNMGQGFRLHANAMNRLNPLFSPSLYSIRLKNNSDIPGYKKYLQKKLGETIAMDASIEDRVAQMGIISGMKAALFSLSLFFIIIILLTTGNDILISIKENQRQFGIFKSVGWTPKQTRFSIVWKVAILIIAALIIAVPLSIWLSPLIMGQATSGIGLIKFPFIADYLNMLIATLVVLGIIISCSWWLSKGTVSVNPRTLINS